MHNLLIATNNRGKVAELGAILGAAGIQFLLPGDVGLSLEVAEAGDTYAQNARLKAAAFARASGLTAIADDSGLEVDALDGRPGVHSARYAGPGASDADRRHKLVQELGQSPAPRRARFRCALAVARPGGDVRVFEGVCEGEILLEERGMNGFGYDPLFFVPEYQLTLAQLPPETKNQISHRARAVWAALPYLREITGGAENP